MQYLLLSSHCSWLGSKQDDALTQLSQLVGPGKEFIPSEVPTLQTIIQRGILIRDRMLLEQGSAKTDVHIKDIVLELVFSDSGTMANLKCQIYLHTRGSVKDNEHGPAYVLHSGGGRQEGDATHGMQEILCGPLCHARFVTNATAQCNNYHI